MNILKRVKVQDGKFLHQYSDYPSPSAWIEYGSSIDAIIGHCRREIMMNGYGQSGKFLRMAAVHPETVSRERVSGKVSDILLARFNELTGIPIEELRFAGAIEARVVRHPLGRQNLPHLAKP